MPGFCWLLSLCWCWVWAVFPEVPYVLSVWVQEDGGWRPHSGQHLGGVALRNWAHCSFRQSPNVCCLPFFYFQVTHVEPWEKGSRKTAGQTGMCGGVSRSTCIVFPVFLSAKFIGKLRALDNQIPIHWQISQISQKCKSQVSIEL